MKLVLVAPLAGAWIEMTTAFNEPSDFAVAPLAGAWIEIFLYYKKTVGMFIPLLRNGQEKMVSVSVVGEDRIIYISSDMFKLYEQGLSEPDGIRLKKEFYLSLCSEEVCYV